MERYIKIHDLIYDNNYTVEYLTLSTLYILSPGYNTSFKIVPQNLSLYNGYPDNLENS